MTHLLFPGRHLVTTAFQEQYLRRVLRVPLDTLRFRGDPPDLSPIDQIVFAVTSANQQHSRYNPIPFHVRAIGVDRFARSLEMTFGIRYRILGVPHYRPTPRFAQFVLKEVTEQSEGNLRLTPENCVVLCCTESVATLYEKLGFSILPAEAGEDPRPATPKDVIRRLAAVGDGWRTDGELRRELSAAAYDLWQDFPDVPRRVIRLWRDPLLTDSGDLTESRDYDEYAFGMGNQEIIAVKYDDIREAVVPGKIVDEGCADGALLARISRGFPDSDLIGIEITGEFLARARERQRAGDFGGSYVYFHQRNITRPIFEPNSVDTTICNSTVHELWSYGNGEATVRHYLRMKYEQTAAGGRLLIRDVVGPPEKERQVYLWLDDADGSNDAPLREADDLEVHLNRLSTYARFLRFARDFRAEQARSGQTIRYREERIDGRRYVVLSLAHAVEYLSKKDYTGNWHSEMNEQFAFWSPAEWEAAARQAGFRVVKDPEQPRRGTRAYTSRWILENRWQGRVALFERDEGGELAPLPWPPTNIVLVAEKKRQPG